jgi:GDP-L-fucose synthase
MLSHVNLGSGIDLEISELAKIMASVVGFDGIVEFDSTKPDGVPKKLLDVTRLESLGWKSKIDLLQGLELTYHWFSKYDR